MNLCDVLAVLGDEGDNFNVEARTWSIHWNKEVQILREDAKDLEEKYNAEKMSVDALEATLFSLNDDYARLQEESIKIISVLKYNIVVKNKRLKEKEEIIN